MLELFTRHGGFDLRSAGDRRPRRRSAPHGRGRRHRARRGGVEGARRSPRHQPRRLLRHADGRNARRRRDRSRRPRCTPSSTCTLKVQRVGDLQAELVHDFFEGFAQGARANVHVKVLYGRSSHHQIEALFKAFARALRVACSRDRRLAQGAAQHQGAVCDCAHRLRRRQPDLGPQGLRRGRRGALHAEAARSISPGADGIVVPGVGHFAATAALDGEWRAAIRRRARARRAALRHLSRPAVAVRRQRRGAGVPGLGASPGRCRRGCRRR